MNVLGLLNRARKGEINPDEICEIISQMIGGDVEMSPFHETDRAELESAVLPCLPGTSATILTGKAKSGAGIKMVFILEPISEKTNAAC